MPGSYRCVFCLLLCLQYFQDVRLLFLLFLNAFHFLYNDCFCLPLIFGFYFSLGFVNSSHPFGSVHACADPLAWGGCLALPWQAAAWAASAPHGRWPLFSQRCHMCGWGLYL